MRAGGSAGLSDPGERGGAQALQASEDVAGVASQQLGARGQTLIALSNAIVAIHKQFYGKGPTKARAHLSRDVVTVVLDGGYTRGEQTLQDRGHEAEVVQSRLAMQRVVEGEFRSAVEAILGRSVRSFMSANDPTHDLQVEVFVLHPDGDVSHAGERATADTQAEGKDDLPAAPADLAARARRAREEHRELLDEHRALRSEQQQSRRALRDQD